MKKHLHNKKNKTIQAIKSVLLKKLEVLNKAIKRLNI